MEVKGMNIWEFSALLTRRLRVWAGFSMALGALWARRESGFRQGMGMQFAGWGLINALIAFFGGSSTRRRRQLPDSADPQVQRAEAERLRRLLWINTGLDIFYVLGGWLLARTRGAEDARWRGHGWGIIVQGGFLFFFDLIHASILPSPKKEVAEVSGEA
jgi:hypothetical protein